MADGLLSTLKKLGEKVEAIANSQSEEFNHITTALGDVLRDLTLIKERLPVRKAGKVRRRGVHQKSSF